MNEATLELFRAVERGDNEGVLRALELGADVNAIHLSSTKTALLLACDGGQIATVRLLLQRGANIEAVDNLGYTALHYASLHGARDVVKYLITLGADVDCRDRCGRTPLMFAVYNDLSDILAILIEAGADVKLHGDYGTALDMAQQCGEVVIGSLLTKVARRQEATMLLNWMLAMAPPQLPIYIYLDLANISLDIEYLNEMEKIKVIQGAMDSYRHVMTQRCTAVTSSSHAAAE